jgi:integrase
MAPGTRLNDIRAIGQLFTFAKTRGISDFNPVIGMTRPKLDTRMPVAMPVQDVKRLLEYVEKKIPWHSHQFALGFFAGVRPAELSRMTWANVNLAERLITIGPEIAKTRRVRHIAIEPNLAAWLTVPRESPDLILPRFNPERRIICEELKLEWPPDVMRHSFATYHVARYEDPGRTAYQLGHTNGVHVLYDHYRGLATKAEAEEYWKIVP